MSLQLNDYRCAGNLTRDPEFRALAGDRSVCNFGMAIHRRWRNQSTQEMQEETTFIDVEAWGSVADFIAAHMSKGDALYISGHLKQKSWTDEKTQEKRSRLVVVADEAKFVLNKPPQRAAKPPASAREDAFSTHSETPPEGAAALPPRAPAPAGALDEPPF